MMLFNIGEAEMTVGELMLRGCYLGSNVTYNVKAMVEQGYLTQQRSVHDRRSVHIRLTEKGKKLRDGLTVVHRRHVDMLTRAGVTADGLQSAEITLRWLERFWSHTGDLVRRSHVAA
jgi:DNA-binding MarR family transcriptional regulator